MQNKLQPLPTVVVPTTAEPVEDRYIAPERPVGSHLEVLLLRWKLIVFCVLLSMLLGYFALLVWPRTYESDAKLLVRVGRESVSLDPTATTSDTLMLQKTQEEEIITALEILGSQEVLESVVDKIGAPQVLGDAPFGQDGEAQAEVEESGLKKFVSGAKNTARSVVDTVLTSTGVRDDISDRELAIKQLRDTTEIFAPRKSNVIRVHCEAKTPQLAQAMAQAMTDEFMDRYISVSHTEGSLEFFEAQVETEQARLTKLIDARREYMRSKRVVSIEVNRRVLSEKLVAINKSLAETWGAMRRQIYTLELEEQSLSQKYPEGHSKVQNARRQLAGARRILSQLQSDIDTSTNADPKAPTATRTADIDGVGSIVAQKKAQRDHINQQIDDLLQDERELTRMDRDIETLESSLGTLREKREEARVIERMNDQRISNIRLFQKPTFVERAAKPSKRVLAAGAVMFGLLSGLGLAFWREARNSTLRTAHHVESKLRYPVLSTIPRLRTRPRLKNRRQQEVLRKSCRAIISELLLSGPTQYNGPLRGKTLGVIGVNSGCGASTVASTLALVASEDCRLRTILIDADSNSQSVANTFDLNGAPGLAELIAGESELADCISSTKDLHLELMSSASPSGKAQPIDPREVASVLDRVQNNRDLIVVDLPAADIPNQAVSLAQYLDYVVVVVESERTDEVAAQRLIQRLNAGDTEVIGVVLNKARKPTGLIAG